MEGQGSVAEREARKLRRRFGRIGNWEGRGDGAVRSSGSPANGAAANFHARRTPVTTQKRWLLGTSIGSKIDRLEKRKLEMARQAAVFVCGGMRRRCCFLPAAEMSSAAINALPRNAALGVGHEARLARWRCSDVQGPAQTRGLLLGKQQRLLPHPCTPT